MSPSWKVTFSVGRDVSKLDCNVWPKLRTFQIETPVETPLLVVTTRREAFKRTRQQRRNADEPSNNRPAYTFSTYPHRVLLTITHLPYRFDRMSIRQSFVCYLVLLPARQSATSGVNMRSTLGKPLLREEVHENYIENGHVGGPVSQRDGLLLLEEMIWQQQQEEKSLRHTVWAGGVFCSWFSFSSRKWGYDKMYTMERSNSV